MRAIFTAAIALATLAGGLTPPRAALARDVIRARARTALAQRIRRVLNTRRLPRMTTAQRRAVAGVLRAVAQRDFASARKRLLPVVRQQPRARRAAFTGAVLRYAVREAHLVPLAKRLVPRRRRAPPPKAQPTRDKFPVFNHIMSRRQLDKLHWLMRTPLMRRYEETLRRVPQAEKAWIRQGLEAVAKMPDRGPLTMVRWVAGLPAWYHKKGPVRLIDVMVKMGLWKNEGFKFPASPTRSSQLASQVSATMDEEAALLQLLLDSKSATIAAVLRMLSAARSTQQKLMEAARD